MALFDALSPVPGRFHPTVKAIVDEANTRYPSSSNYNYTRLKSYEALAAMGQLEKKELFFALFPWITASRKDYGKSNLFNGHASDWLHGFKIMALLLGQLSWQDEELLRTAQACKGWMDDGAPLGTIPFAAITARIEANIRADGLNPTIDKALKAMLIPRDYLDVAGIRHNERLHFLMQGKPGLEINAYDAWGKAALLYLEGLAPGEKNLWVGLFNLARKATGKNQPPAKWMEKTSPIVEQISHVRYAQKLEEWLKLLLDILRDIHKKTDDYRFDFLRDDNQEIIKALIWCAGPVNDLSLNRTLDDYAVWAYKKKPGVGAISPRTGMACMYAFTQLPFREGVARLAKFRTKIRNNTVLKSIDRFLQTTARANGMSREEMEELSVSDFGIRKGHLLVPMAGATANYAVESGRLTWYRDGKIQKNVPANIKTDAADALKSLKSTIKEIDSLLPVVKDRLEQSYLGQRAWSIGEWRERYIDHALTSIIACKLIWHFNSGTQKGEGMWIDNRIVDAAGQEISWVHAITTVQLWHPIGFAPGEVMAWRNFLRARQISQPFKQAYREVYILTDAELRTEVYSNRFAAHILRQHQFAALCRLRGWQYHLQGQWDSHNTPTRQLSRWGITAFYFVNPASDAANTMGIYNYVSTDQVRFTRAGAPLPLHDVPALVFTEVMRDVDLFVGVTSLGNDPGWQDGGDLTLNRYWREYSFSDLSESAKIRSQVLQSLIPRLRIGPQCSFDKKFLIINGKVRTYKIHLGSGNILMEPNDQYLCIVPDSVAPRNQERVFLPFEGDNLLSIILSKALLLAADDKITDQTIISQIRS